MKNMTNENFVNYLNELEACSEAIAWVKSHGGTSAECWRDCVRGDWMAWLVSSGKLADKRALVGALADCAALALPIYEREYPNDNRARDCINACRRYSRGKATEEELQNAAFAAYAAAYAAARTKTLKKCADILRKHFAGLCGQEVKE